MSFRDLDEFLDHTLSLPVRGKTYVIESPDAETGLWCQEVISIGVRASQGQPIDADVLARLQLDDEEEAAAFKRILGDAYDEMVADGVPWEYVKHCFATAMVWAAGDTERAEMVWSASDPKAQAKQPADRKPPAKSARPASTGTK